LRRLIRSTRRGGESSISLQPDADGAASASRMHPHAVDGHEDVLVAAALGVGQAHGERARRVVVAPVAAAAAAAAGGQHGRGRQGQGA
jgi:hypothetical protein